jgi:uncharacterized coiled-coil protein SlyX
MTTTPRRPAADDKFKALEKAQATAAAEVAELRKAMGDLADQVRSLTDTLTKPGPTGSRSVVEMWREHAARDAAMDWLTRRLRNVLGWAAALAGALGLLVAAKALGIWPTGDGR